jgi:lysozyme
VNGCVTSTINQNQFDALVIFAYNVGNHALQNSTLLKKVNTNDFKEAFNQFLVWDKVRSNGMFVEVNGLKNRRLAEQKLFNTPMGV